MNDQRVLRKLQLTELEILLAISTFCSENGIQWFLDSGTALGAARHHGFIPWDDDVDIGMLRDDYDRFIALAEKGGLPQGYSLHTPDNTHGYAAMFSKVYKDGTRFETSETNEAECEQGIFIDVFPYDFLALDESIRKRQVKNARLWQYISYVYHAKTINVPHGGFLGRVEKLGCRLLHGVLRIVVTPETIQNHFENSVISDSPALSSDCISLCWTKVSGFPKAVLVPPVMLEFEGYLLPSPAKYDEYLCIMYGDWRSMPSIKDRRTHLPRLIDFNDGDVYEAR